MIVQFINIISGILEVYRPRFEQGLNASNCTSSNLDEKEAGIQIGVSPMSKISRVCSSVLLRSTIAGTVAVFAVAGAFGWMVCICLRAVPVFLVN